MLEEGLSCPQTQNYLSPTPTSDITNLQPGTITPPTALTAASAMPRTPATVPVLGPIPQPPLAACRRGLVVDDLLRSNFPMPCLVDYALDVSNSMQSEAPQQHKARVIAVSAAVWSK